MGVNVLYLIDISLIFLYLKPVHSGLGTAADSQQHSTQLEPEKMSYTSVTYNARVGVKGLSGLKAPLLQRERFVFRMAHSLADLLHFNIKVISSQGAVQTPPLHL